jgi:hypothetical protein
MALNAVLDIPVSFAVTYQYQLGHCLMREQRIDLPVQLPLGMNGSDSPGSLGAGMAHKVNFTNSRWRVSLFCV